MTFLDLVILVQLGFSIAILVTMHFTKDEWFRWQEMKKAAEKKKRDEAE